MSTPNEQIGQLSLKARLAALTNLPRFFKMAFRAGPSLTIANVVIRVVLSVLPLLMLYIGKLIIDHVIFLSHNASKGYPLTHLWELVTIEFGLVTLMSVLNRAVNLIDTLLGDLFTNYSSVKIMSHAATLDLEQFEDSIFYDKLERARLNSSSRVALLSQVLSQMQDFITLFFLSAGLILFNPWFTLILVFSTIPSFIGEYYFNSKNYELSRSQSHRRRELEYINSIGASNETAKEVRIFNLSSFFINRYNSIFKHLYRDNKKLGIKRSIWGTFLAILGSVGYYIAFVYIIEKVISGALSIGSLTFLLGSIRQVGAVLQNVSRRLSALSQGSLFLSDFFNFFTIEPKIFQSPNPRPFPKPIKRGFTFENVGFKYSNSNRWANRHLNFELNVGEKLALVGENGAGKTTLVKLLVRLYDPTEGRILLDGFDLREYDLVELRMQIGIIFQDFLRYQMTVSENIAVGNIQEKGNSRLIERSAKQSLANSIIERLPYTYDQMLGRHFDQGVELSGGEWQKIALARAYMRNAELMILDEPTAALDARSEYEVFQRFAELTKDKTSMLISHRFSTVRMANRILVLEKGEILEIGSHEELLEKKGKYAELFQLQAMGYR
ncbi:MAG: ABC transporter ATP-binding protein/permease [Bacteroidota bacterium]|nr:ABC transporter ATP-binding protein/permease [Bacteroidota bacterium]